MTQEPRWRADSLDSASSTRSIPEPSTSVAAKPAHRILDISRTLAAHGAGVSATELAFDLVLHEIVEQVCDATQATGVAVGWMRDGDMVCRATTGTMAPQLGIRFDIHSGMAAECVSTGEIQNCLDTAAHSKANAESSHQPSVRSMLLVPVAIRGEVMGILQLLSEQPAAFAEKEVLAVRRFVNRILESRRETEDASDDLLREGESLPAGDRNSSDLQPGTFESAALPAKSREHREGQRDYSNLVLSVAILTLATVLGFMVGWRGGFTKERVSSRINSAPTNAAALPRDSSVQQRGNSPHENEQPQSTAGSTVASVPPDGASPNIMASGSLVISENGKVIYRSSGSRNPGNLSANSTTSHSGLLLRRVDPQYPADAIAQRVQGPVVLDVKVLAGGDVGTVEVISGDPLLVSAAVEAIKSWRFQPYSEKSEASDRRTRVTINFKLPQ